MKIPRLPPLIPILALLLSGVAAGRAEDKIWSAVIVASNRSNPREAPQQLLPVFNRLKRVFGYNQFEILGSTTTAIDDQVERWLVPTERFWLNVKARRASAKEARGGYLLNLQLFQDKRQLVETEAKLAPESPLFIRGPLHASGQILIVLQVQPK
ncbi:MAG: hypothetical protein V4710_02190 [Verrucomicrobiota bacterium]